MVHAGGAFKVTVALTNTSGRTLLVPDDLGDGLGIVDTGLAFRLRDGSCAKPRSEKDEKRLVASGAEAECKPFMYKHPAIRLPYRASCSPLAPGATREAVVPLDAARLFRTPGRHRLAFVWDCLLDPDDRGRVARFSAPGASGVRGTAPDASGVRGTAPDAVWVDVTR